MDQKNEMNMSMEERNGQATFVRQDHDFNQESRKTGDERLNQDLYQETGRTATAERGDNELYQQTIPKGGEAAAGNDDQENGLNSEVSRNQG